MISPVNVPAKYRGRVLAATIRLSLRLERKVGAKIRRVLQKQFKGAATAYAETGEINDALVVAAGFNGAMLDHFSDHYYRVGDVFGDRIFAGLKGSAISLEMKDAAHIFKAAMDTFVFQWAAEKVQQISKTTMAGIRGAVYVGQQAGEGVEAIAKRIRKFAGVSSSRRSRMIARTETHSSANYAQQEAARSTGIDFEQEWLAAEDSRTRPDHNLADGQRVPMNEPFRFDDGTTVMYPGEPGGPAHQVINCRCTTTFNAEY